ncbi:hypothetical protein TSOC_001921 [Tetrabaena socialis]|uniref:phytol kinase n=1 Tax=Tetrabaena socialis TaxID=47790 RepID=A0A2J8AFH0_9CHLO|nr:hypothetical protein TSOC_001921 [Tetrabaena socialis]|eukprot:PNH11267.1 hypothetical protein TSOC_001921 [Tetrabaena socialis]
MGDYGWSDLGSAARAACVQQLLDAGLLQSLDTLLRLHAASGRKDQRARDAAHTVLLVAGQLLPPILRAHDAVARDAGAGAGAGGDEGGAWWPQDELGVLVSAAKLVRREAADPDPTWAADIAVDFASVAYGLSAVIDNLPPPSVPNREGGPGGGAAAREGPAAPTLTAAVREVMALACCTALPILERAAAADGTGAVGGGRSEMVQPEDPCNRDTALHTDAIRPIAACLVLAVQAVRRTELLALQPQRALALLSRLLLREHDLRRPAEGGVGGSVGGGARDDIPEEDLPALAGTVAGMLVHMAADEQLVGAVAGWLRGEAVAGTEAPLDPGALAAALRPWNAAAADAVARLHAAAAAALSPAAVGGAVIGDGASAVDGGGVEGLLAAARSDAAKWRLPGMQAALARLGDTSAWPPLVLRLCGNPSCRNFAGPVEADLPLRQCSACKSVRYCGAGCQRQHWREGGHKAACARLREGGS